METHERPLVTIGLGGITPVQWGGEAGGGGLLLFHKIFLIVLLLFNNTFSMGELCQYRVKICIIVYSFEHNQSYKKIPNDPPDNSILVEP